MIYILAYLALIVTTILFNIVGNKYIIQQLKKENEKLRDINLSCLNKLKNIQESQHYIWNHLQKLKNIGAEVEPNKPQPEPKNTPKEGKDDDDEQNKKIIFQQKSVLLGHTKSINSFAIYRNLLASASDDCTIRLWNLDTRKEIFSFFEPQEVSDISINYARQTIVAGGFDCKIVSWKLATKALDRTFADLPDSLYSHDNVIYAVIYSHDGKILISGSADKNIRIWDTVSGKLISILNGHSDAIISLAISPCDNYLVSGSRDKTIKIWNLKTLENSPETLNFHSDWVTSVAITSDGKDLVTGSKDKTVKIWSLQTKKIVGTISKNLGEVWSLSISPDSKIIAIASLNNTVELYEFATKKHLQTLDACCPVIFGNKGEYLITGDNQNKIKIWQKN